MPENRAFPASSVPAGNPLEPAVATAELRVHRWVFDGDDPYIVCRCGEYRDALSGRVIVKGDGSHE